MNAKHANTVIGLLWMIWGDITNYKWIGLAASALGAAYLGAAVFIAFKERDS